MKTKLFLALAVAVLLGACASRTKNAITDTALNDKLTQFFVEEKAINDDTTISRIESMNQVFALVRSYVLANADNELGIFLFERFHPSMPDAMKLELIEAISVAYPKRYTSLRKKALAGIEEKKRLDEQAKSVAPGNKYKEIRCKGVDGEEITLSDVVAKNRYVLLDFWATWCAPCMGEVPHLIEVYKQFHDKGFEIYALSIDDDSNAWRTTVKEKGMPWVNVLRKSPKVTEQYGLRGVPSNFLIDCSTGKIIAVHLRGETLTAKLAELFE